MPLSRTDHYDHDQPPPPPPEDMPPLPRGPPPKSYRFQGDTWRPQRPGRDAPPESEFSFRVNDTAPRFSPNGDRYRPTTSSQPSVPQHRVSKDRGQPRKGRGKHDSSTTRSGRGGSSRGRGQFKVHITSKRPLLTFERGNTPEKMLGMSDQHVEKRFLDLDDMSDSGEEDMEESDVDESERGPDALMSTAGAVVEKGALGGEMVEHHGGAPISIGLSNHVAVVKPSPPVWSNPECYTALPPTDESQRRKKDVVKLIRKARITVEKPNTSVSQVAANDDFISFSYNDEVDELIHEEKNKQRSKRGVPGAPSGPRKQTNNAGTTAAEPAVSFGPKGSQNVHDLKLYQALGTNDAAAAATTVMSPARPSVNVLATASVDASLKESASRGKRKRSLEPDESTHLRPPKRTRGPTPFSNGYILQEWTTADARKATPWLSPILQITEQPGFRLHKEICDFYEFVRPQGFEQIVREDLLQRLRTFVKNYDEDCELHCFGSFAAKLYLPNADMDLVVVSSHFMNHHQPSFCQSGNQMFRLADLLVRSGIAEEWSVEVITKAKVPLVKFIDRMTNLKVDMSFENKTGLIANGTFDSWQEAYPAMPIIVTVIKQFLLMRGLNEVVNGGLGGFSVTCLVTSLLQNMPRVQSGDLKPEDHLGEILLEFLDFYGNQMDIARVGITMDPPGYYEKIIPSYFRNKLSRLAIIDPNKADNDISGGSRQVALIFSRFARAREEILDAMNSPNRRSLLDWMLGGDYNTFLWQRNHLRKIYKTKWESELTMMDGPSHVVLEPPESVAGLGHVSPMKYAIDEIGSTLDMEKHHVNSVAQNAIVDFQIKGRSLLAQANHAGDMNTQLPTGPIIPDPAQPPHQSEITAETQHDGSRGVLGEGSTKSQAAMPPPKQPKQQVRETPRHRQQKRSQQFLIEDPQVQALGDVTKTTSDAPSRSPVKKGKKVRAPKPVRTGASTRLDAPFPNSALMAPEAIALKSNVRPSPTNQPPMLEQVREALRTARRHRGVSLARAHKSEVQDGPLDSIRIEQLKKKKETLARIESIWFSQVFELEFPEIAAVMEIPPSLDPCGQKSLVQEYVGRYGALPPRRKGCLLDTKLIRRLMTGDHSPHEGGIGKSDAPVAITHAAAATGSDGEVVSGGGGSVEVPMVAGVGMRNKARKKRKRNQVMDGENEGDKGARATKKNRVKDGENEGDEAAGAAVVAATIARQMERRERKRGLSAADPIMIC